jgi:hypothetical protein
VDEHARPDLRDEQADVVIDAVLPADVAGGGGEAVVAGERIGNERVVEVVDRGIALNGPLVSAPSLPAPVVDGLLPVRLAMKSMNSSGSS